MYVLLCKQLNVSNPNYKPVRDVSPSMGRFSLGLSGTRLVPALTLPTLLRLVLLCGLTGIVASRPAGTPEHFNLPHKKTVVWKKNQEQ